MFDSTDNFPTEWYSNHKGGMMRQVISKAQFQFRLLHLAKYVFNAAINFDNAPCTPEELLQEWLEMTYRKQESIVAVETEGV